MIEYVIQINWPSKYERRAYGYDVARFDSIRILTREEILGRIKSKIIKEQISEMMYLSKIPKEEKEYKGILLCKDEEYTCSLSCSIL